MALTDEVLTQRAKLLLVVWGRSKRTATLDEAKAYIRQMLASYEPPLSMQSDHFTPASGDGRNTSDW